MKDLKELMKFAINLGMGVDAARADGKIDLNDAAYIFGPLMTAKDAFDGLDLAVAKFKSLNEAERLELVSFLETELELSNDKVEILIEKGFALLMGIYGFVGLFKKEEAAAV